MQYIETEKGYLFIRDCNRNVPEKNKKTYNIADGLWVTFGLGKNRKYKLCSMSFSKAWFDADEAEEFWRDMEIRLLHKETSWNRKLPELSFAIDVEEGYVVVGNYRGLPKSASLKEQYELMEAEEDGMDIIDRWHDDYLRFYGDEDIADECQEGDVAEKLPEDYTYEGENQYIRMFMEQYKGTDESVIAGLSVLNAASVAQEGLNEETFVEKYGDDIMEFFDFFIKNIYTEGLEKKMLYNWGGELPRILRIGSFLAEERSIKEENGILDAAVSMLQGKRKRNAERLAEYFLQNGDKERLITIGTDGMETARLLRPGYDEENRKDARRMAFRLFAAGGSCVFRTCVDDEYEIVNGFRVTDGKPECISVKELRYCMQLQPDGRLVEFPSDRYQVAFIKFE